MKRIALLCVLAFTGACPAGEYPSLCLDLLVRAADAFLKYQLPDGRFCASAEDRKKGPEDFIYFRTDLREGYLRSQHFILACAVLYTWEDKSNPYFHKKELLDAILRAARFSGANVMDNVYMEHRYVLSHSEAFRLVQAELPREDREQWKKSMLEWGGFIAREVAAGSKHAGKYTAQDLGVNTNHWAYFNLALLRLARLFARPDWEKIAAAQFRNLIRVQDPDGYWDEGNGPTPSYNYVDVHAVAGYHLLTNDKEALKAIERALGFHVRFTYPDGAKVETVDGRVPLAHEPVPTAHFAFSYFPEGRTYALRLLRNIPCVAKKSAALPGPGEFYAHVAENLLHWQEGPQTELPVDKPDFSYRLKAAAGVRRQGPWFSTFSAIAHEPWPENQFFLDRQVRFSVWHDSAGLIVAGPNSRGQPRAGAFCMSRNIDQMVGVLHSGELVQKGGLDILNGTYDGYASTLTMAARNDSVFEVRATVVNRDAARSIRPAAFEAHLFLPLAKGDSIQTEGSGTLRLPDKYTEFNPKKIGQWIKKGRWTLRVPANTMVVYPFPSFNPYSLFGHPGPAELAMVIMQFPSEKDTVVCRVEVSGR